MLGERIKGLREEIKFSREELAEKLKISYWALSKYETGEREPDYDTLRRIADFFDVSTDYLLGRVKVRKYVRVPLATLADYLPDGPQKDFIIRHKDELWVNLAKKMEEHQMTPQDVADILDMVDRMKAITEKRDKSKEVE